MESNVLEIHQENNSGIISHHGTRFAFALPADNPGKSLSSVKRPNSSLSQGQVVMKDVENMRSLETQLGWFGGECRGM